MTNRSESQPGAPQLPARARRRRRCRGDARRPCHRSQSGLREQRRKAQGPLQGQLRRSEDLLPRQPLSELREAPRADQKNRTPGPARYARRPRQRKTIPASIAAASCAGPVSPPAVSPRSAPCRSPACKRPRPVRRRPRARGHHPQKHLHALRGRLHRHRGSVERRLDRPGAELGFADQPRLALRQGRRRCANWSWANAA